MMRYVWFGIGNASPLAAASWGDHRARSVID